MLAFRSRMNRMLTYFAPGNTFGGVALSSYGGFWIGLAIILIPGGFEIAEAYGGETPDFYTAFAFYVSRIPSQSPNLRSDHPPANPKPTNRRSSAGSSSPS